MHRTVSFSRKAANVFLHLLTRCNLQCRHCYINPEQHGTQMLPLSTLTAWLELMIGRHPSANLVLLGGEPTLHPELARAVAAARAMGYASITIDTNGYLFHDILEKTSPDQVDFVSFSLDGASARTNDAIRGTGSFERCLAGIRAARQRGFTTSLIYTVSALNIDELAAMPPMLAQLGINRFFIQVIGLRGHSAAAGRQAAENLQIPSDRWLATVPEVARQAADRGVACTYPKVYLEPHETFECAGRVAHNYFIFPNGRVYRCPLCEDFPLHSLNIRDGRLEPAAPINEADLFRLDIPEGCVMNKLIQPGNISYNRDGSPVRKVACCLLKEEVHP